MKSTQGDAFFFAFTRAKDAVGGAIAGQKVIAEHEWPGRAEVKVRMGLHTGEPTVADEGYHGLDVVRAARICSAGHGGQILLSETTRALLGNDLPEGVQVRDLGEQNLKDVQHERVYQLTLPGERDSFPPLKTSEPSAGSSADSFERRAEELATSAQEAIEQPVLGEIERAFKGKSKPAKTAAGAGLRSTVVGLVELVLLVATIVVIVLLIRWAF